MLCLLVTRPEKFEGIGTHFRTTDKTMETKDEVVLLCLCLLATASIFINAILFVSVMLLWRVKLNISKAPLISATLVNLLTAASYHPILISFILQNANPVQGEFSVDWATLCKILSGLERGVIVTITWSIASACLDKYLCLTPQVTVNRSKLVLKLSLILSFSAWMIGTVFGIFSYLLTEHKQSNENHYCLLSLDFYGIYHLIYCAAYITLGFVIPVIIMILLYSYTTKQLFIHRTLVAKNSFNDSQIKTREHKSALNSRVKESKLLVSLILFFLVTVTPYFIMNLILSTGHWTSMEFPDSVYISLVLLLHTNCCICPLLCGFSNKRIRLVLVDTIKQRITLWLRCERRGVRGEASEEINFISADCSFTEGSLTITGRNSIVSQDTMSGQMST